MSAAGPAGGRGKERPSARAGEEGCAAERATRLRGRRLPLPSSLAPLRPHSNARAPTGGPRDSASASPHAPQLHVAPASTQPFPLRRGYAPSLTSRPRHCFSAVGWLGPALASECGPSPTQSLTRRVLSGRPAPRLSHGGGSPHPSSGSHPFTQVRMFFLPSAPEASRCGPLNRASHPLRVSGGPREASGHPSRVLGRRCFSSNHKKLISRTPVMSFAALPGKLASNGEPP